MLWRANCHAKSTFISTSLRHSNINFVGALFNGECRKGFYQRGDTTRYYIQDDGEKYYQYSGQTVFERPLLEDMTNNISISDTSFESRAEVYNKNFCDLDIARLKHFREFGRTSSDTDHPWKLTERRAEDAWFLYTLVCFYRDISQLDLVDFVATSLPSQRVDNRGRKLVSNHWIHHKCEC